MLLDGVAEFKGYGRPAWITKSVALTSKTGHDIAKGICHSVNADLVVDSDGQPLGDDHVVVQIAKSLSEEDVPSDWMFSMRAWHITRVFLNGASLYDHEQRFIYKTALWAYNRTPQIGVHQYWSSRQRQDSENPPKKVVKLSSHLINAVMSSTCCNQNCFHGDCKLQVYKKAVTLVQFSMIYIFRPLKRKLHLRATSKESIFQLQYISMYKEHFFFLAKL
jgi:hypothetical protein